jgi:hypothetical protein
MFAIGDAEAREWSLRTIVTDNVKAERDAERKGNQRGATREARLAAIRAFVDETPTASASDVLSALESQGISSSNSTVKRELTAMFPQRERAKSVRKTATTTTSSPSLSSPPISKRFGPSEFLPEPFRVAARCESLFKPLDVSDSRLRCPSIPYSFTHPVPSKRGTFVDEPITMQTQTTAPQRAPRLSDEQLKQIQIRAVEPGLHARHLFFAAAIQRPENQAPALQQTMLLVLESIENEIADLHEAA